MIETMPTLSGYQMIENIYDGPRTLIYQAKQSTDNRSVVIKFLKNEYPSFNELVQFRNQYTIAKNLELDGIVHPYALEKYHNGFALIMEEVGADSLHHYITANPLALPEFFNVAIATVKTLEGLYKNRVIHKDIKPQNILIHPETKQIKLIDFSISSLLPRESQEIQSPNVLEGTLAYLSPEQTGRMNRGIDYRTDFYSLGVTFYELLTGQLPFQSDDPMELVHCHIAKMPKPPMQVNSAIPAVVNDLILKLMAKKAEERYQSAFGIRDDLENCQQQWEENDHITPFTLGQRDISDRFQIPEKLYGREAEVATLLAAFDRVSDGVSEMMLVAGFSGIGKTVLVNEVHKPIVRQRGYFIKGKFDQFKRDIPFSALVQAFQTLMRQLFTETAEQMQGWKTKILDTLGDNGQVLIEVIPELEQIIGPQPPVPELAGTAAQNRFNLLFERFINVFTTAEHPLVIFLDDLQWIDSASLKLIQLIISKTDTHHLLLMGAYRNNEVSPAHPLMLTLEEIQQTAAFVNKITLTPLDKPSLNHLIADTLSCPQEMALPLTDLVIQKTKGNPFFTNQFLKLLYEEELISFDLNCGYWQCDITQVNALTVSDDIVEFMAVQLQKLSQSTQNVLKLAACIGNQFDLATLAIVYEKSQADTAADLWKALQEGLILPLSEVYKFFQESESIEVVDNQALSVSYRFYHDRVQQAAYSLISENQKPKTHLSIGQLLKKHTRAEELEDNLFDIVNQLNQGIELITEATEREELAQLNLKAGGKARHSTAYAAALRYFSSGLELLATNSWQTQYDLTLALYESAADAASLSGDFARQEQLAEVLLTQAKSLLDKVKTYEVQSQAYIAQNMQLEAVKTVLPILKQLGVEFPEQPCQDDFMRGLQETQLALEGKSIEELYHLPPMTAANQQAAIRILSSISSAAYQALPMLLPLIVFKQVQLSVNDGNVPESVVAYSSYGLIFTGVVGNIEAGYQFGQLALNLLEKLNAKGWKAKTYVVVFSCLMPWNKHVKDVLKPFIEGYQSGLETGDLEFGAYCASYYCTHSYWIAKELTGLEQEMVIYSEVIKQLKQENVFNYTNVFRQTVLNLTAQSENPYQLLGEAYNESNMLPRHQQTNDRLAICLLHVHKLILSYLFQYHAQAVENASAAEPYLDAVIGSLLVAIFHFYDSLARLAVYPAVLKPEQESIFKKVAANQEKMRKWADHAPMNFQHKFDLVEAEWHRILSENVEAMDYYDRAIAGAKENEYLQEEALANELASQFYLAWGKEKVAQVYLTEAYYAYARWGAKAKVEDLEKRYPQLLAPILISEPSSLQSNKTITHIPMETGTMTRSMGSDMLDLTTVMKASQTLSGEIVLSRLLEKMMKLVIENAGAQRGFLVLETKKQWCIEAASSVDEENVIVHESQPIKDSNQLSEAIVRYVIQTKENLVLHDAAHEGMFIHDPYISQQQPQSILCLPLLNQGKLSGLLYLENNLSPGAFTPDRLAVLNLLSSQLAISLDNARLYDNLDGLVKQRTQELSQALNKLKTTQTQLVESEKMAALGGLVAGVAHEINTPIGICVTSSSLLDEQTDEFVKVYKGGKMKRSALAQFIEDVRDNNTQILSNLRRAAELVQSFKQVAVDQSSEEQRVFNVKAYLEEIILHLKPKLRGTQHQVNIQGDDKLSLNSYPGVLSQIVTNFVMNSLIHAYDKEEMGTLTLTFFANTGQFTLQFQDDGKGMPEDVKARVFEPFFTTQRTRGGSGLGLHIIYNLVTQQLKGQIRVKSQLGEGTTFTIELPIQP
jgi:predicted ATPase/signal transduction histidine kinase